ncbi:lysozyme [Serratia ficaria]|uniref:lysozyme n=1 Tax=Serratia ficaria TaxID=61651 RepID=UPI0021796E6E|nr:lysozyme [Serratia ficaria]CAI1124561.1 Phage-related lysozyme (muraminidase) [Serratia ficaria]CAI1541000.1 Phage-related lysozyme (muraminidase) [Serratia ficaria]CAI2534473.1 Phage-related lysozyme (muraminidase) [Serratia ficaria]CAI2538365.1 Phage-related lysozyme (muraminidase) [Serratia ficaria]
MNISERGLALIKHFEGLRLAAYRCPANVWTIGYGHTAGVQPGNVITEREADSFLRLDIAESVRAVNRLVKVPLTSNQFDALVSFVFNLGAGSFLASTLLKKLNTGAYTEAADEFSRWVNAGGKLLPGLVRRRVKEKELFLSCP